MHCPKTCCACWEMLCTAVCPPKGPPPLGDCWNPAGGPGPNLGQVALTIAPVGAWPAALTTLAPETNALGRLGAFTTTISGDPGLDAANPTAPLPSGRDVVTGLMKCGRIHSATTRRTVMKPTSVRAMA